MLRAQIAKGEISICAFCRYRVLRVAPFSGSRLFSNSQRSGNDYNPSSSSTRSAGSNDQFSNLALKGGWSKGIFASRPTTAQSQVENTDTPKKLREDSHVRNTINATDTRRSPTIRTQAGQGLRPTQDYIKGDRDHVLQGYRRESNGLSPEAQRSVAARRLAAARASLQSNDFHDPRHPGLRPFGGVTGEEQPPFRDPSNRPLFKKGQSGDRYVEKEASPVAKILGSLGSSWNINASPSAPGEASRGKRPGQHGNTSEWGQMTRRQKPNMNRYGPDFLDSLRTHVQASVRQQSSPSQADPWSQLEKKVGTASSPAASKIAPDADWGKEFDKGFRRPHINEGRVSPVRNEGRVEERQKDVGREPEQKGRGRDRDRRSERFDVGYTTEQERGSRGRGGGGGGKKQSSRRSNMLDMEEDDGNTYDRYEERERKKAVRKAQRETERTSPVPILLPELISINALAEALKIRPYTFLAQLGELGFENVTLDSLMAGDTAALVAQEYGYEPTVETGGERDLKPRPPPEDPSLLPLRPPVVTIMGHVDHGKTTLLDFLRNSSVAAQEHGGITQHIGAFSVELSTGKIITFLDTPGHAAFLTMRQRGANVTDIVVLVVAADDSVKPQTLEALNHARAAKVPIIVAINKIDKDGARIDQVKADLSRRGVEIEDFGGDVQVVCVSGKTGQGMADLEENILTLSEILDHRAEVDGPAEGWILESSLKPIGKVATILVKRGTLRPGDYIAAGLTWAKIRHLRNEAGVEIDEAGPGMPVEILGWKDLPAAGDEVIQAPDEGRAKNAVTYREGLREREKDAAAHEVISEARRVLQEQRARKKAIASGRIAQEEELPEVENGAKLVNFVVRGDVHGSVEAVCAAILELGNHEVQPRVLRSTTGPITEFDVEHAAASNSIIVNFATTTPARISRLAEEQGVRILEHTVIYHLTDDVKARLSEHLAPDVATRVLGEAEVLQIFPINIKGRQYKNIAGCRIRNGVVGKSHLYRVLRRGDKVFEGKLEDLKQLKKDVTEVRKGGECGVGFVDFQDFEIGDEIQAYEEVVTKRSL